MTRPVCLITGVGDGTGAALARRFAEAGGRSGPEAPISPGSPRSKEPPDFVELVDFPGSNPPVGCLSNEGSRVRTN